MKALYAKAPLVAWRCALFSVGMAVLAGCTPLSLASAVLGSLTEEVAVAPRTGPFAGVPTRAQNGAGQDTAVRDVMAMDRNVNPMCRMKLPKSEPMPLTCELRPVCLPGAAEPMILRLCPDPGQLVAAKPTQR